MSYFEDAAVSDYSKEYAYRKFLYYTSFGTVIKLLLFVPLYFCAVFVFNKAFTEERQITVNDDFKTFTRHGEIYLWQRWAIELYIVILFACAIALTVFMIYVPVNFLLSLFTDRTDSLLAKFKTLRPCRIEQMILSL